MSGNATKAQAGIGSTFGYISGNATINIAEILTIGGPSLGAKTVDATNMGSPSAMEEVIPTIVTSGEVAFDANLLVSAGEATQAQIRTDLLARTLRGFSYQFPTPLTGNATAPSPWTFNGYWTKFDPANPSQGKQTTKMTIKITGVVTVP